MAMAITAIIDVVRVMLNRLATVRKPLSPTVSPKKTTTTAKQM